MKSKLAILALVACSAIAQTAPPDVVEQWIVTNQILGVVSNVGKTYIPTLPNLTRYKFHYFYVFINKASVSGQACTATSISTSSTAIVYGSVATGGTSPTSDVVPIGGLLNILPTTNPSVNVANFVIKANGGFSSIIAEVAYLGGSSGLGGCQVDVLYKGTVTEEEGTNAMGAFAQTGILLSTAGQDAHMTEVVSTHTTAYTLPIVGPAGFVPSGTIGNMVLCILPEASTGVFRDTSNPVVGSVYIVPLLNPATMISLGTFVIYPNQGCAQVRTDIGSLGTVWVGSTMYATFSAPTSSGYPFTGGSTPTGTAEFSAQIFVKPI
jgi:hypothetical protein